GASKPPSAEGRRSSDEGGGHVIGRGHHDQQVTVAVVAEQLRGRLQVDPPHLVDLVVGNEGAAADIHDPVGHHLGPILAVAVLGVTDETAEAAVEAGLLPYLAHGALLEGLAGLQLPLGERPVGPGRPVDDGHLRAAVGGAAEDDPPGGPDQLACLTLQGGRSHVTHALTLPAGPGKSAHFRSPNRAPRQSSSLCHGELPNRSPNGHFGRSGGGPGAVACRRWPTTTTTGPTRPPTSRWNGSSTPSTCGRSSAGWLASRWSPPRRCRP